MGLFTFNFDFGKWALPIFRRKPRFILIVEDDPATSLLIANAAEACGLETVTVGTAEEAKGVLHDNGKQFILAVVDINLPAMNGWILRRVLKDTWPGLRVVVISESMISFQQMPRGERLTVFLKSSDYGELFRDL